MDTIEGVLDTIEGVLDTIEGVLDTLEGVRDAQIAMALDSLRAGLGAVSHPLGIQPHAG